MDIVRIDFKKTEKNKTILNDRENLEKIEKWILPIIEKNKGWGTGNLTKDEFFTNPEKFQDAIDATVWGEVMVVVEDKQPVGLLEFTRKRASDIPGKKQKLLVGLLAGIGLDAFEKCVGKKMDREILPEIKKFLNSKVIYTNIGIVLIPSKQGKKTGLSEKLYKLLTSGIVLGWTSNPVVVRQRQKTFDHTLVFPPYGEFPNTVEEWAMCLYVYLYTACPGKGDSVEGLEFGAMKSIYYVENRGKKYIDIAKKMEKENKISKLDGKRLNYALIRKSCAVAVVSWN